MMNRPIGSALAAIALLTSPALAKEKKPAKPEAAPEKVEPTPDVVILKFAWPEKLTAKIDYSGTRKRRNDPPVSSQGQADLQVSRVDGQRTLTWSGSIYEQLGLKSPVSHTVNEDGTFGELKNTDKLIDALIGEMTKRGGDAQVNTEEMKKTLTQVLLANVAAEWNASLGIWIDAELEVGEVYASESEGAVPGASAPVKYANRFSATRRLPCTPAEKQPKCVELTFHSEPDPAAIPDIAQGMMRMFIGSMGKLPEGVEPTIKSAKIENGLTMIVDPATLLPYEIRKSKHVAMTMALGDKDESFTDVRESAQKYTYAKAE